MAKKSFRFFLLGFMAIDFAAILFMVFISFQSSRPIDPANKNVADFTVEKGEGARDISSKLEQRGLISNSFYFNFYIWRNGYANSLQAGSYELSPSMSIAEIANTIKNGEIKQVGVRVTIPEGFRTSQLEDLLIANGVFIQRSELVESADISAPLAYEIFEYDFLKDLPSRATIDGFLFPDTYIFKKDAKLNDIVLKMLFNFGNKVDQALRVKIKASGRNLYEVVIMASMLEREVKTKEDMRLVAGVLWKRMEIGMPLQVDATLAYITGKKTGEITNEDKLIDSPYNTYKYRGIPPTPIANPGLMAIQAAAEPQESEYLYYLSTPSGETIFSKTLEEHSKNKAKHLR